MEQLIFAQLAILFVMIGVCAYLASLTWSLAKGAPYVGTNLSDLKRVMADLHIGSQAVLYELGCGSGAVLCMFAKETGCKGIGIDVSPLWIFFAKIRARITGLYNRVHFKVADIRSISFHEADVLYVYMMPRFLLRDGEKLFASCKPGARIISYVFDIPALKDKLTQTMLDDKIFIYTI